ncbi:hypothetical protein BC939DRAFT_435061 [Gamsiella multidivaricata]|uniref:uncharacterized protein n=1 Tax=Gamsiella multidivaricata TaxID=101098 RepID=UPI0022208084|nr:uncharacterized protein BC939DRAFT_435061 [Gamsiella multidivaricata]KAI7832277.1 hypothetical protein BC939DRAFT_435061 [Gamsiella multidivaricata]
MATSFVQLFTALYEWTKECPTDLKKDLDEFFMSKEFLDRPEVFYKGFEDSSEKWVALITMKGVEDTHAMLLNHFQYDFMKLHEARGTFSQVSPAPQMPNAAAYNKFVKDLSKANRILRAKKTVRGWARELDRATEMVMIAPGVVESTDASNPTSYTPLPSLLSTSEKSAASFGMWFISVDIESYEREHSRILEIGWSIWESRVNKFVDKHYAIADYRHLRNGKYVADRRDRFMFGETVWASLRDSITAFQEDLQAAASRNAEGIFALIAHDMSSDEGYLKKMGVVFPKGMIKFDTLELNGARAGDSNKTGLGKLLDELNIDNYCLHNAGNDAHYTLELFMYLVRNNAKVKAEATLL